MSTVLPRRRNRIGLAIRSLVPASLSCVRVSTRWPAVGGQRGCPTAPFLDCQCFVILWYVPFLQVWNLGDAEAMQLTVEVCLTPASGRACTHPLAPSHSPPPWAVGLSTGGGGGTMGGRERHAAPPPPQRRTPAAVSMQAEKERARNWEERKQQSNWAPSRPTHGSETSPNRTHNNTQGNHEVRALQQPPNAAHAERAISKHPPPSLYKVPTHSTRAGTAPRAPGGARHGGGNRAVTSQPRTGQFTLYGDVKSSYGGAGGWDRSGCAKGAPRSANRQGEEQHRHRECGSHTKRDKGGHSRQGGGAQRGRRGNQNSGNREPEWSGWESVRMGGSDNKGDGLASQPRRYRVPGQPLLNRHHVGGVSRSPDGLLAQQEREPIRGRPAVRGKRAYGGRPGQRMEEQGTWASRKHSEAGYGRPVDRGAWTAKTVKRPRQQPAHPQYANYWAPLTRKRHTMPHSAQPQHTNY